MTTQVSPSVTEIACMTPSSTSTPSIATSASTISTPSPALNTIVGGISTHTTACDTLVPGASSCSVSLSSTPSLSSNPGVSTSSGTTGEVKKEKKSNGLKANEKRAVRFIGRFGSDEQVDRCRNYFSEMARCNMGLSKLVSEVKLIKDNKKRKSKQPVGPKKTNSRILFMKDYRKNNEALMPKDSSEATKLCSAAWKNLLDTQKQPWKDMASKINEALRPVRESSRESKDIRDDVEDVVELVDDVVEEEEEEVEEPVEVKPAPKKRGRKPLAATVAAKKRIATAVRTTRSGKRVKSS